MKLNKQLKSAIKNHALSCYPSECCGLVINNIYHPCNNIAPNPSDNFEIDPVDFVELSSLGDIQAIVHSHPNGNAQLSDMDRVQMGLHGVDWLIYGVADDEWCLHAYTEVHNE